MDPENEAALDIGFIFKIRGLEKHRRSCKHPTETHGGIRSGVNRVVAGVSPVFKHHLVEHFRTNGEVW